MAAESCFPVVTPILTGGYDICNHFSFSKLYLLQSNKLLELASALNRIFVVCLSNMVSIYDREKYCFNTPANKN